MKEKGRADGGHGSHLVEEVDVLDQIGQLVGAHEAITALGGLLVRPHHRRLVVAALQLLALAGDDHFVDLREAHGL